MVVCDESTMAPHSCYFLLNCPSDRYAIRSRGLEGLLLKQLCLLLNKNSISIWTFYGPHIEEHCMHEHYLLFEHYCVVNKPPLQGLYGQSF